MEDKRLISGMPLLSDAYLIGEYIISESKRKFENEGKILDKSNQAICCVKFTKLIDEGVSASEAWKECWAYFEYLEFQNESHHA